MHPILSDVQARTTMAERHRSAALERRVAATRARSGSPSTDRGARPARWWSAITAATGAAFASAAQAVMRHRPAAGDSR